MEERTAKLRQIRDEILAFTESPLYQYRLANKYFPVIGEGDHQARVMFVGEAPGRNEAETGRPFCGAAGRILDELLNSIGLERQQVYVTNILKDRPPGNRDPEPVEIEAYTPFLERQIEILEPSLIVTLGRFSMKYIMEKYGLSDALGPITQIHGQVFLAKTSYGELKILPLYHPAATIYHQAWRVDLAKDFQKIKKLC